MKNEKLIRRTKTLDQLKLYFLDNFVEDPVDGTEFDCDVLNSLDNLLEEYKIING